MIYSVAGLLGAFVGLHDCRFALSHTHTHVRIIVPSHKTDGTAAPTDWNPLLSIWDVASKTWIAAKDTCPPELQFEEIVFPERRYTVHICHLTEVRTQ